ncbi:MAG: asparagine synthase C-terminal domain-containing protein [Candidatus Thorarchaeota archaeon]
MEIDRRALEVIFRTNGERFMEYPFPDSVYPRSTPNLPFHLEWKGQTAYNDYDFETVDTVFTDEIHQTLDQYSSDSIGVMLSGGIDSALCLYLVKREFPDAKVVAYHSDWGSSFVDGIELEGAKNSTKFVDVPLRIVDSSIKSQLPYLEDALRKTASINYSATLFYTAFDIVEKEGMDVSVTGDGVDSFFGGHRFHKVFYMRTRLRIVPFIQKLLRYEPYIMASKMLGTEFAWFVSMVSREPNSLVNDSNFEFSQLYEKVKSTSLWDLIQNWGAANVSYDAFVAARCARANNTEVDFPFMKQSFLDLAGTFSQRNNYNKRIIRMYMADLGFPRVIWAEGLKWDKKGWGGSSLPYFVPEHLNAVRPRKADPEYWFTSAGLKIYRNMERDRSAIGYLMTLFLKIIELLEEY